MLKDAKRTPKVVLVAVQLRWRLAGEVKSSSHSDGQGVSDIWMPVATQKPGLYRISIDRPGGGKNIYIGEGANVSRRLDAYTQTYSRDRQKRTEARMSRRVRKALAESQMVMIDVATTGKIDLDGLERPLHLNRVAERRFAEAAAVLAQVEQDVDGTVVVLNRVVEEDWLLED